MNTTKPIYVFVYGTLMKDEPNHRHMSGAQFIGHMVALSTDRRKDLAMFDLGPFPALVELSDGAPDYRAQKNRVSGELYLVSEEHLARLDAFEGAPRLYERKEVFIIDPVLGSPPVEVAFAYVMREGSQSLRGAPLIRSSSWRHRSRLKESSWA